MLLGPVIRPNEFAADQQEGGVPGITGRKQPVTVRQGKRRAEGCKALARLQRQAFEDWTVSELRYQIVAQSHGNTRHPGS